MNKFKDWIFKKFYQEDIDYLVNIYQEKINDLNFENNLKKKIHQYS